MRNRTEFHCLSATILPFLYQTRTILQSRFCRLRTFLVRLKSSRSSSDEKSKGLPDPKVNFLKIKAGATKTQHGVAKNRGTTITRTERKVFDNIFADIAGNKEEDTRKIVDEPKAGSAELDHDNILAIFSSAVVSHQSEQKALAQREAARTSEKRGKIDAEDWKKLQQYPKPLRKIARRAQVAAITIHDSGHETPTSFMKDTVQDRQPANHDSPNASLAIGSTLDDAEPKTRPSIVSEVTPEDDTIVLIKTSRNRGPSFVNPLNDSKRVEDIESFSEQDSAIQPTFIRNTQEFDNTEKRLRDPNPEFNRVTHDICREAMIKISNSFKRAIDDEGAIGLWNACLSDVFPMIEILKKSFRNEKTISQKELNNSATEKPSPSPSILAIPPYIPPLYVISRVYPAALLLALRLFVKHFPTSSLPLALLPEIRSNGATSYVLGASVHFYNTLLSLRWDIYSDLQSIDNLLREMERNGIEFDLGTWEVLAKIGNERSEDLEGKQIRGKTWWERPTQEKWYQKVGGEWKGVIAEQLQEQGIGVTTREDDSSAVAWAPRTSKQSAMEQQVWL